MFLFPSHNPRSLCASARGRLTPLPLRPRPLLLRAAGGRRRGLSPPFFLRPVYIQHRFRPLRSLSVLSGPRSPFPGPAQPDPTQPGRPPSARRVNAAPPPRRLSPAMDTSDLFTSCKKGDVSRVR